MEANTTESETALRKRIAELEQENKTLRETISRFAQTGQTVSVPEHFKPIFDKAQETVKAYFNDIDFRPEQGTIEINGDRYVLVRAATLSIDFFHKLLDLYADRGKEEAIAIGKNFLFDIAHVIGLEDAHNFHRMMNLSDPVEKLSAGPVHFAYSGWAFVDILPESNPSADEHFFLKYNHPFSFEADSWIRKGKTAEFPVCIMNAAYSSGWCEASFGIPLTAVEISCRARGDANCTFIMAPPDRIGSYLEKSSQPTGKPKVYDVPMFFERKQAEEKIRLALREKEILLREIHHRVKNNLQIISSLLNLQSSFIEHPRIGQLIDGIQGRIKTMALVHEKLYQSNLGAVDLADYLQSVGDFAVQTLEKPETKLSFRIERPAKPVTLKIDQAIPIGLLVNEIITNAIKYAFPGRDKGMITICITLHDANEIGLFVADDGIGSSAAKTDAPGEATFGAELIRLLIDQLGGTMELQSEKGYCYNFRFQAET